MATSLSRLLVQDQVIDGDLDEARAHGHAMRTVEALLFAASEPLSDEQLTEVLPSGVVLQDIIGPLVDHYANRGVNLVRVAGRWAFRTAPDLAHHLVREQTERRKLSRAALETLAIVAYHQPATRAEIEDIRGVATGKGTLDLLLETGWVRMRGRRKSPGRPITFGTTPAFLEHFGLDAVSDLPGLDELQKANMFDGRLPKGFAMPVPSDDPALAANEDPLEPDFLAELADERINEPQESLGEDDPPAPEPDEPLDPLDGETRA
jgi:segregation and condensation protein B